VTKEAEKLCWGELANKALERAGRKDLAKTKANPNIE